MCGILGIAFQNGHEIKQMGLLKYVLRGLLNESKVRGSDATGVAFIKKSGIHVIKDNIDAKELISCAEFGSACVKHMTQETISIIGHCRLKTKGAPADNNNNHPIITNNIVGVHNGVISNDEDLFEKFQKRFRSFKRAGRVDSEIIFRLIDHYVHVKGKDMVDTLKDISHILNGDFACAAVDRTKPYMLWLFRNTGPIYVYNYPKCGIVVFASSASFIEDAVDYACRGEFGEPEEINVPMSHCLGINLKKNTMFRGGLMDPVEISDDHHLGLYCNI